MDSGARQLGRQRFALGLAPLFLVFLGRRELFELHFDRRQVGIDRFLEQPGLFFWPTLGLHTKAPPFMQRQFMGQLLDLGLAPDQFTVLLDDQAT